MRYQLTTEKRINGRTWIIDTLNDGRKIDVTDNATNERQFLVDVLNDGVITWENLKAKIEPEPIKEEPKQEASESTAMKAIAELTAISIHLAAEIGELKANQRILVDAVNKLIEQRDKDREFNLNLNGLSVDMFKKKKQLTLDDIIKIKMENNPFKGLL